MTPTDILVRARAVAMEAGATHANAGHLLAVLVETNGSAGEALRASGLTASMFGQPARAAAISTGMTVRLSAPLTEIIARARGLALGRNDPEMTADHLLVCLLWYELPLAGAEALGERHPRVQEELARRGVDLPAIPAPAPTRWGPATTMSIPDFKALAADLHERGQPFRFNRKRDRAVISILEPIPQIGSGTEAGG